MSDLAIWIFGWYDEPNAKMLRQFQNWYGDDYGLFVWNDTRYHESHALNAIIDKSIAGGYKFFHLANSDVLYDHHPTIPAMLQVMRDTPDAGLIRPWMQGEPICPDCGVDEKYVEDGTGMILRLDAGVRFDDEMLGVGWCDLDLGNQLSYEGWRTLHDRRYPVFHKASPQSQSSFLFALSRRSKLIIDIKWGKVGRANWGGVDAFNAMVPVEEQIPSMNWLISRNDDELQQFALSVAPEHQQVLDKDKDNPNHTHGGRNPNHYWLNPVLVGYSTRERFEQEYGRA